MQAIIMAGGKGTRLKPFTVSIPKPLVPINDKPIISSVIEKLKIAGFTDIIICVNHMADYIKAFCGDGSQYGISLRYSNENEPLGTIGPLSQISNLEENFLVINGDTLTDLNLSDIYNYHINNQSNITIGTTIRNQSIDFGVINQSLSKNITTIKTFIEKPTISIEVAMGINVFNRNFIHNYFKEFYKLNNTYSCGLDNLILDSLKNSTTKIVKYSFNGFWLDIGRPDDYNLANSL